MIRLYKDGDLNAVTTLAMDNAKATLLNISDILKNNKGRVLVYTAGKEIQGFGFFQPFNYGKRLDICVVVDSKCRRQGIGTQIYNALSDSIDIKFSPETLEAKMVSDDLSAIGFAKKQGFSHWFNCYTMVYNDELLPTPQTTFHPFEEKYYDSYYDMLGKAFFDLRSSLDSRPHTLKPNGVIEMMFDCETFMVLNSEDKPIAAVTIDVNHIDDLSVHPEAQGLGFGRQLAIFATNKALLSEPGFAQLDVVESNVKAYELYRSLGYKTVRTLALMRKNIE